MYILCKNGFFNNIEKLAELIIPEVAAAVYINWDWRIW